MYFSEQFSPLAENMMTGGKEKLKLGLRIYTIQVRSLRPYNVAVHDSVWLQWADTVERRLTLLLRDIYKNNPPSSRKHNNFKLSQKNPCSAVVINKAWHTSIMSSVS